MPKDHPSVEVLIRHTTEAIRRAFAEGYRQGELAAIDKMINAVGNESSMPPVPPKNGDGRITSSTPAKGVSRVPGHYGQVIGVIRAAVMHSNSVGITKDAIFTLCEQKGIDLTINQYRDTLKRLTGGQEVVRRHGAYFTGPRFRRDLVDNAVAFDFDPASGDEAVTEAQEADVTAE